MKPFNVRIRAALPVLAAALLPLSSACVQPGSEDGAGQAFDDFSDGGLAKAGAMNVAEGKSASQSSTAYRGAPARAVDGDTNGSYSGNSVTHTESSSKPWWRVDLGGAHRVDRVTLWNRTDCCTTRLSNFHVDYLDADGRVIATRTYSGSASRQTEIGLSESGVFSVRVQLNGTNPLSLAEVQVWGNPETGGGTGGEWCSDAVEGGSVELSCPSGQTISGIDFASYGTPAGSCDAGYTQGACHASSTVLKVASTCVNKQSCTVSANNGTFGDPCSGTRKSLAVAYTCNGGGGGGGGGVAQRGVHFAHYSLSSGPTTMPNYDALTPDVEGVQANVDISKYAGTNSFGMVFWGQLYIAQAGAYTFQTRSDDGSILLVDGKKIVDNDGRHGARERTGDLTLSAGYHPFALEFFENAGGEVLELSYRRGSGSFAAVPNSMLFVSAPSVDDDCPADPNKTAPGVCGCGKPDTDGDRDGTADCKDLCPADASKTQPGECGCGKAEGSCGNPTPTDGPLDRANNTKLRIGSWNAFRGSVFPKTDTVWRAINNSGKYHISRTEAAARVFQAVDADIWQLQETVYSTSSLPSGVTANDINTHIRDYMRSVTGDSWSVDCNTEGLCTMLRGNLRFDGTWNKGGRVAGHRVILPDGSRVLLINVHYMNVSHAQQTRDLIASLESTVSAVFVGGDFNDTPGGSRYNTIDGISGMNVLSMAHWKDPAATHLSSALANRAHVNTKGYMKWGDGAPGQDVVTSIGGGHIDHFFLKSSTWQAGNRFTMNTLLFAPQTLKMYGLRPLDIALRPMVYEQFFRDFLTRGIIYEVPASTYEDSGGLDHDHLPMIVDFTWR